MQEESVISNKEAIKFFRDNSSKLKPKQTFVWALLQAKKKSPEGTCCLANCYDFGIGTKKNKKLAVKWYGKAAALGDKVAQYNYATILEEGKLRKKIINWLSNI